MEKTSHNLSEDDKFLTTGERVLRAEADAVNALIPSLGDGFISAIRLLLSCKGKVAVSGMGKSGHIGKKIAATLASTGTPSFFVHPGEASHGDLGMITSEDVSILLSNSGEGPEVLAIVPILKRMGSKMIALTGNSDSTLARLADIHLYAGARQEACPLGLAPSASTTAALAMGDALALTLMEAKGLSAEDFARSHPGGALGRRLLIRISDIMHTGDRLPIVTSDAPLIEVLYEISSKGLGMTAVVAPNGGLLGIYTDGDLRRTLQNGVDIRDLIAKDVVKGDPHIIRPERLASEAVKYMQDHKINGLLVVDAESHLVGALNMHDLFKAGVV